MVDAARDALFGKIALSWRLLTRDLLNRALSYQRAQQPETPLSEIIVLEWHLREVVEKCS